MVDTGAATSSPSLVPPPLHPLSYHHHCTLPRTTTSSPSLVPQGLSTPPTQPARTLRGGCGARRSPRRCPWTAPRKAAPRKAGAQGPPPRRRPPAAGRWRHQAQSSTNPSIPGGVGRPCTCATTRDASCPRRTSGNATGLGRGTLRSRPQGHTAVDDMRRQWAWHSAWLSRVALA